MKPNEICLAYKSKKKLTIYIKEDTVIIEGREDVLEFLGNLILAQAKDNDDCSFAIGPKMAGNAFFTRKSTHGIYIHRLPCHK